MENRQDLIEYAQGDAKTTLEENMLAHFYCDVPADDPGHALEHWLKRHLGRTATHEEWKVYDDAYRAALGRAIRVIEAKLDPEGDDEENPDSIDHHNEIRGLAEDALKG
jgi:hypothetical protein